MKNCDLQGQEDGRLSLKVPQRRQAVPSLDRTRELFSRGREGNGQDAPRECSRRSRGHWIREWFQSRSPWVRENINSSVFFQLCFLSRLLNLSLGFLAFKFEVIKAPTPSGCFGGFNGRTDVKHLAQHLAHSKCSINTRGYRECHFSVRGGG